MSFRSTLLVILLAGLTLPSTSAYAQKDWQFELEPYYIFNRIGGEAAFGRRDNSDVDLDFGDLIDRLDSSGMLHFEVRHRNGLGFALDYGFLSTEDTFQTLFRNFLETRVDQGVMDAFIYKRDGSKRSFLDIYAGIRWWDNDVRLSVYNSSGFLVAEDKASRQWVDPIIGARWQAQISRQWNFWLAGDVGGFGVESDFTSSVQTGFQWEASDLIAINVKYKATWVDFQHGQPGQPRYFNFDTVTHGPLIGIAVRW